MRENVAKESRLHTDAKVGQGFAYHERVNHFEKEFARGVVATNSIEGLAHLRHFMLRQIIDQSKNGLKELA